MSTKSDKLNPAGVNYGRVKAEYVIDKSDLPEIIEHAERSLEDSPSTVLSAEAMQTVAGVLSTDLVQLPDKGGEKVSVNVRVLSIEVIHRLAAREYGVKYGSGKDNTAWLDAWNANSRNPLTATVLAYRDTVLAK